MKKILFLMLCVFVIAPAFAQKKKTIYLKNGSVIKGRLVQLDDNKMAISSARNTWVFDRTEIDTVVSKALVLPVEQADTPWFVTVSGGLLIGSSNNSKSAPFSLLSSFNYEFAKQLYGGIGVGVDFLEESYIPVFANVEYCLRNTNLSPFISLKGGYMIPLDDKSYSNFYYDHYYGLSSSVWPGPSSQSLEPDGGFFINPSFGFRGMVSPNLGWTFSLGYRFHELNFLGEKEYKIERNYNRLSVSVGVIFN